MSVTIVSALPSASPAPQANMALAGSDGAAIGLDFAGLLLGQTLKGISTMTGESAAAEPSDQAPSSTEADNTDASALFAALGLAPPQPAVVTDTTGTASGATKPSDSVTDVVGLAQQRRGDTPPLASDTIAGPAAATLPAVANDDKTAKFAVPAATTEATVKTETVVAADGSEKVIATIATHTAATAQKDAPIAVHTHVRDQSWSSEFAQKIVWIASNDKQSAQLTLNPPQMGPIEISLNVDKGNATAAFVSANAEVRDAIETAMPRLREMFANAGIQLGQTNVSSESFRQQSEGGSSLAARSQGGSDNAILAGGPGESLTSRAFLGRSGNGLVDLFA